MSVRVLKFSSGRPQIFPGLLFISPCPPSLPPSLSSSLLPSLSPSARPLSALHLTHTQSIDRLRFALVPTLSLYKLLLCFGKSRCGCLQRLLWPAGFRMAAMWRRDSGRFSGFRLLTQSRFPRCIFFTRGFFFFLFFFQPSICSPKPRLASCARHSWRLIPTCLTSDV